MAKILKTTQSTPEQRKANPTVVPQTPKKKKKKKKQSYKDMMAAITKPTMTTSEKIQEKREALKTPSAKPPKLVTI